MEQRTIKNEVYYSGRALQTGRETDVICKPAEPDTGIVFIRKDLDNYPSLQVNGSILTGDHARRSSLKLGPVEIQTIEHFLAALWGAGVDNILVEINGSELPAMDGSAKGFLEPLKKAGTIEQGRPRRSIKILDEEKVKTQDRSITIFPDNNFSIAYTIDYDIPSIGKEEFSIELDQGSFEKEIAPARTFCLKEEAEALLRAGLGKGADFNNTLVMDDNGPIETTLRFKNEPVRHKILDLVGDLYILGFPVIGRVVAKKSGHDLNAQMVRKIYEKYVKQ